ELLEGPDQPPVAWIAVTADRLEPAGAIDVSDGGDHRAFVGADRIHLDHERIRHGAHEVGVEGLLQDGRSERPKLLAELDLRIDDLPHVRSPWIREDAAVAEGPRPPFHATLKPPHDLAGGNPLGDAATQLVLVLGLVDRAPQRAE